MGVLLETKRDNTESNLGNLITDSMVEFNKWDDINIGFINDGGIRATVVPGEIIGEDLIAVLPFGNTIDRVTMFGGNIKGLLEEYAANLCANATCEPPTFLQMSGLRVEYDIWEDPTLPRVTSLRSRCSSSPDQWCDLEPEALYPVAVNSFLAKGGSRTMNFPAWIEDREEGGNDFEALVNFVNKTSPITAEQEGRITIRYHPDTETTTTKTTANTTAKTTANTTAKTTTNTKTTTLPSTNNPTTTSTTNTNTTASTMTTSHSGACDVETISLMLCLLPIAVISLVNGASL